MTIIIDVPPEIESWLQEQARLEGRPVERYVLDLIERQRALRPGEAGYADGSEAHPIIKAVEDTGHGLDEWTVRLRALARETGVAPSDEDVSRGRLYADHL